MFVFAGGLTGQVGIVHSKDGWMPWLIRLITGSHWSHVVVAINDVQCVSQEPDGAQIRPIAYYPDVVWSRLDLTPTQRRLIVAWSMGHLGTPYSWPAYYVAGIAALLKEHTPDWLELIAGRTDRLICSQFVDLALQAADVNLFQDARPRGAVTPGSFGKYFYEHGFASVP